MCEARTIETYELPRRSSLTALLLSAVYFTFICLKPLFVPANHRNPNEPCSVFVGVDGRQMFPKLIGADELPHHPHHPHHHHRARWHRTISDGSSSDVNVGTGTSPVSHAPNHLMLYLLLYRVFCLILPDVQSCSWRSTISRRQREEREVVGVILLPAAAKTIITSCVGVGGARPAPARRPNGDVTVTSDTQHEEQKHCQAQRGWGGGGGGLRVP